MKTAFILFFLLFALPLASAQTVSIGDYSTAIDSEVTVLINISDAESVAGGLVNISFDPYIVSVEHIGAGDFGDPVANINNISGWIILVAARADNVNKNEAMLANIVFNGSSNGTSALTVEYASLNNETGALITPLTSNGKIVVSLSLDDTSPPSSIRDLVSNSGSSWINWTWTNPSDSDFNHTMVYLDGKFVDNTSDQYFNATNLIQGTLHTIGTRTVDLSGNVNETWVNDTAMTTGALSGGLHVSMNSPVNFSIYSVGEQVRFEVNVSDPDDNPISSGISAYVELSGPNNISKHIILSEENGHFVGGYTVDSSNPRGLWSGNVTAYNSTSSGQMSFKIYFTSAYFIQPYSNSHSYLLGESANFTAKVMKPGNPDQYLSNENVSLNLSIFPYNSSTPVLEYVEMVYDNNLHLFSANVSTDLIGPGLFTILFIGNDTSGNIEVASLLIGVSEDYAIEVTTENTDYDRDNPVNILGTVKYLNNSPLSNINVNLLLDLHGFKRSYVVNTNEIGEFNYTFHPFDTEAGNYTIKATAANMGLLRTAESSFTIHGLYVNPQSAIVDMVENSSRTISYTLHNLGDTTLTSITTSIIDFNTSDNVVATIDPLSMPSQLNPYESASFNLQIEAGTHVPDEAKFQIEVTSDQTSNEISELQVNLFSPTPILRVYPENVIVGLNQNQTSIETVSIYNMGYGNLRNITLHQPENSWMRITSNTSIGDLQPGENTTFDIHVNSFNVGLGTYFDSVGITSDNYNEVQVNLTAFVTDLQNGSLLFHVTDALERDLSNASVSLINKETYDEFDGITNSSGYALLENLPVGRYIFEVSSDGTNTLPQMGTVEVEAMEIPELIEISLYMSFIDFDWEVTPTSIEDYYNVILKMRFETDVPIPLLLAFPPSIDYNMVPGEEKTGSFKVYNVGLVSIYNVSISPINYNGIILDPLVTNVDEIKGKSNIEVPYKIKLSSSAANCQLLSGKINIQGRYVHFINNREVISYARTSIPVTVKTPVDGSCIPDWPDIPFCFNFDGLHFGTQTENLSVDPNIIWLKTGLGWGDLIDDKNYTREDVAIATNHNEIGSIRLTDAIGITFSIGVNEIVSYFTMGTLTPQIPLGIDLVTDGLGVDIPFFDKFWFGDFTPNVIAPNQSSTMDLESLNTGVGVPLPALIGGGLLFEYGNLDDFSCFWLIPIGGYDLTLPTFGLPDINIHFPHVYLPGGSIGGGTFIWNSVPNVFIPPSHPHFGGTTYVPWNWPDWNWPDFSIDQVHRKPRPRVTETIHEVIELSISQNVTMERDAFWAGLGIFNKMPDKNIDNVGVTLHIRDDTGSANDKFFIKSPNLININDVDGSGVISPLSLSTAQWLIIPKPGAGGINPEGAKYNISANITYSVDGINFETVTHEIEIVVKPQPEMVLDYFIPSDVIANNPFKLAVKVTNDGYGEARDFAIETAQPVIYYNPSGLLLDFEIIRSQLDGEERSTSMKVDFGDIQPGESKIAWWDMVTSIDGTFTEFTGEFTHSSELGGMETSLIKDIHTYIIQKELGTGEMGYDFLANSESDENYYILFNSSTGSSTFVNNANYAVINMPTPENPVLDISIEDYTGEWVIVSIEDPYNNAVPIEKVIRTSDGTEIPSYNYWMRNERILIVDHYTEGFDGEYTIIFKYSNVVPVITTNRTMFDGRIVVEENKAINFSGSDSYDEFGSIVSYKWEFGDGKEKEGENVEHTYSNMGEYEVILNVTNNAAVSNQASVRIYVVKEIVNALIIRSDYTDLGWNLPSGEMEAIERDVANYYFEVSYRAIFLNFTNHPQKITLNRMDYFGNTVNKPQINIILDVTQQAINNSVLTQNFVIIVTTQVSTTNLLGIAYRPSDLTRSYPVALVPSTTDGDVYGIWAHEIGHVLGHIIENSSRNPKNTFSNDMLWDLYNNGIVKNNGIEKDDFIINAGSTNDFDIMSSMKLRTTAPPHFSSMSKVLFGWMIPKTVNIDETVIVEALEQGNYGGNAFIFNSILSNNVQYVIEAREKPKKEVVVYKLQNYDLITDIATPVDIIKINGTDYSAVTINNIWTVEGIILDLGWNFVYFSVSEETDDPYSAKVTITTPSNIVENMKGWSVSTIKSIGKNRPPWGVLNESNYTDPDIDLHAYSSDGKHVGVNYTSKLYENEIQGALSSGDLTNGEEWIFVPFDNNVSYHISSYDLQQFLEENPDISATNATIEYSATFMEYGSNPKLVQLTEDNWIVQNRTVSEPQIDTIEPGEMKVLISDNTPPSTITDLTSTNGTTYLNWTWTNPPDPDFNHTEIYLNGTFLTNIPVPQNYYNATGLLQDTSYELSTRTVDTSGNVNETWVNDTASTLPASVTTLNLYTGWNLISLPLMPEDTGIASFLSQISGNYSIVWEYNASDTLDHWKKFDPSAPIGNDLTDMEPGKGYWIMMISDDIFPINGTVPESTDIVLKTGWNLIGYNSLDSEPIAEALFSINGNYSIVWAYDASDTADHWKKYDPGAPIGNDLTDMEPGKGYWIIMTFDDILNI